MYLSPWPIRLGWLANMIFPSCCFWNFDQLLRPPAQVPMRSANVHYIRVLQTCLTQGIQIYIYIYNIYKAFRGFGLMPTIGAHLIPASSHGFTLKYWIASGLPVTSAVHSVIKPTYNHQFSVMPHPCPSHWERAFFNVGILLPPQAPCPGASRFERQARWLRDNTAK